jgi:two-component system, NtrC family, sensor kinase
MKALGEAATHLPWICPRASSLVALARSPTAALWPEIRSDPGAVLLVIRQAPAAQALPSLSFFPALFQDPIILQEAICRLPKTGPAFIDWNQGAIRPIYQAALIFARLAESLAERTGRSDPDNAWVAGLLAPLGWLAIAALESDSAAACLADPRLPHDPLQAQRDHWGIDQAAIARRLCRRWQLPAWLTTIAGHLDLSWEAALGLGADPDLFRIVQLAVILAQRQGVSLHLHVGGEPLALAENLTIPECELASSEQGIQAWKTETGGSPAESPPVDMSLLRDLLGLAVENRKLTNATILQALEQEVDQLHRAFVAQTAGEQARLHALKLSALAEFAAGAGHEINNPLAVISGQAQYLLNHEPEPARQRALQAIISQTQRIHQTLNAMMQFARPSPAQKQALNVIDLVQEVTASLTDLAAQRRIQLIADPQASPVYLQADDRQVKTALTCLLRNAIEAAPAEGWAGIRLDSSAPDRLEIMVEDNGPGPPVGQREHLFDPFFSGRQAGRGKGLGLSIAWRLARQNGGEVRYDELSGGPTRFVLSLPRTESPNGALTNGHDARLPPLPSQVGEGTAGGSLGTNGQ